MVEVFGAFDVVGGADADAPVGRLGERILPRHLRDAGAGPGCVRQGWRVHGQPLPEDHDRQRAQLKRRQSDFGRSASQPASCAACPPATSRLLPLLFLLFLLLLLLLPHVLCCSTAVCSACCPPCSHFARSLSLYFLTLCTLSFALSPHPACPHCHLDSWAVPARLTPSWPQCGPKHPTAVKHSSAVIWRSRCAMTPVPFSSHPRTLVPFCC